MMGSLGERNRMRAGSIWNAYDTEVAGQSGENYHPDDVSGYSDQAVCSVVLPCQEMDGRSRLSIYLRFDPSNLSDYHQIGRRFPSHGEKSQLF